MKIYQTNFALISALLDGAKKLNHPVMANMFCDNKIGTLGNHCQWSIDLAVHESEGEKNFVPHLIVAEWGMSAGRGDTTKISAYEARLFLVDGEWKMNVISFKMSDGY